MVRFTIWENGPVLCQMLIFALIEILYGRSDFSSEKNFVDFFFERLIKIGIYFQDTKLFLDTAKALRNYKQRTDSGKILLFSVKNPLIKSSVILGVKTS